MEREIIELNERPKNQDIVFGSHIIDETIEIHDAVELRAGRKIIWARILEIKDNSNTLKIEDA